MRKITLGLILCSMVTLCFAGQRPLEGFKYASEKAPVGNEWESPENIALNKEQPRAWFFSFQDVESARKVLPENSKYWLSLNGDWKFNLGDVENASQKEFDDSAWDDIELPHDFRMDQEFSAQYEAE